MPGDSKGSMTKYKLILQCMKAVAVKVWRTWRPNILNDLLGPRGYRAWLLIVTTAIGAYFAFYAHVVARHERTINRASFERSAFVAMVTSGNRGNFVSAMKGFGPVQIVSALPDPPLLNPFRWLDAEQPNMDYLLDWATHSLSACTKEECGTGTSDDDYRIDLSFANFEGADLNNTKLDQSLLVGAKLAKANLIGADLRGANLTGADLRCARLSRARLRGALLDAAVLRGADLRGADLRGAELGSISSSADLEGAHLGGAGLGGIRNWMPSQLQAAYWDDRTEWPPGYVPPCPVNVPPKPCLVESD